MKQVMCFNSAVTGTTSPVYGTLLSGVCNWDPAEANGSFENRSLILAPAYLRNACSYVTAPGPGASYTYTTMLNGVPQAQSYTIAGAEITGQDIVNTVTLAVNDLVTLRRTKSGSPAPASAIYLTSYELETVGATLSQYFGSHFILGAKPTNPPNYRGLFSPGPEILWPTSFNNACDIAPINGTVTGYGFRLKGRTIFNGIDGEFHLVKNGVLQDGSPGTVDTRLYFILGSHLAEGTFKRMDFEMPFAIGDLLGIRFKGVTSFGPESGFSGTGSVLVASENAGDAVWALQSVAGNTSVTRYAAPLNPDPIEPVFVTVESAAVQVVAGHTAFALGRLTGVSLTASGAATSRTFGVRKNAATQTLTITLADTTVYAQDAVHSVPCVEGDVIGYVESITGVATASRVVLSMVQRVVVPITTGTLVVIKATNPPGSPQLFTFSAPDLTPSSFELQDGGLQTFADIEAGVYEVSETLPDEWSLVSAVTSNGSPVGAIVVVAGESVSATFTNALSVTVPTSALNASLLLMRRLRRFPHLSAEGLRIFYHRIQFDMETGVGLSGLMQVGTIPILMLRWSDDGGETWSNWHETSAGRLGEYSARALFNRLGHGRDRVFELSVSDPVAWRFVDAYLEFAQGKN